MNRSGWSFVLAAAAVMLATLPGRTQGLGLITEPLLADLGFSRVQFASVNFWATIAGALFCFPAGWLLDRYGLQKPTAALVVLLAGTVAAVALLGQNLMLLAVLLTLTRGLGQSALSVASITGVGKRFPERVGLPMALFSIFLSVFFAAAFGAVGGSVTAFGWRNAWLMVAAFLLAVIVPWILLFFRVSPSEVKTAPQPEEAEGLTLAEALRTRSFWTFAGGAALFNLVASGLGLFNESVLAERGFGRTMFHIFLAVTTLVSLGGQFLCGWLSARMSYQRLMCAGLALYAAALMLIPLISSALGLYAVSALMGVAGGMIIVVFFAIWSEAFGRRQLARIQGAAQCVTVLSSALGPVLFAAVHERTGSYSPLLYSIAALVVIAAFTSLGTSFPARTGRTQVCPA